MKSQGINGEFKTQTPYTYQTLFFYGFLISQPPTVTIFVLFDRIFKLFSIFVARKLLNYNRGISMDTLYEVDMAIIRRLRSKYPYIK